MSFNWVPLMFSLDWIQAVHFDSESMEVMLNSLQYIVPGGTEVMTGDVHFVS